MLAVSVPDVTLLFYCRKLSRLSMLTLHFFTLTNLNGGHLNIDRQLPLSDGKDKREEMRSNFKSDVIKI